MRVRDSRFRRRCCGLVVAAALGAIVQPALAQQRTTGARIVVTGEGSVNVTPDIAEIRSGLAAGQRVVVSGQFLVDSEATLKGALARIAAPQAEGSK